MNSIDAQQKEQNHKSLEGSEALKKIKELAKKAETCFFCTHISQGSPLNTRPMSVQKIDDEGNLWFLSPSDSHKNKDLQMDPAVQLFFQGSAHSDFLTLYGHASISRDQQKIEELWEPLLKTWFTEGKTDPRITVIRVTPSQGYYWDNKHGDAVAFVKMVAGAVTGQTLDDSIQGDISL